MYLHVCVIRYNYITLLTENRIQSFLQNWSSKLHPPPVQSLLYIYYYVVPILQNIKFYFLSS